MNAYSVKVERTYSRQDGTVRSASVLLFDDTYAVELDVDVTTGIVGYSSDWSVSGDVLAWGQNHGPATFGHTDVVLTDGYLGAVREIVSAS